MRLRKVGYNVATQHGRMFLITT